LVEEILLAVHVKGQPPDSGKETSVGTVNAVGIHVRVHEGVSGWKFG
jgi:hypothetical protein